MLIFARLKQLFASKAVLFSMGRGSRVRFYTAWWVRKHEMTAHDIVHNDNLLSQFSKNEQLILMHLAKRSVQKVNVG